MNLALKGNNLISKYSGKLDYVEIDYSIVDAILIKIANQNIEEEVLSMHWEAYITKVRGRSRGRIMKKKVFISFDFDNDRQLKDFIIGQSRMTDSPFEIVDHSLKEAAPERNWEEKANAAIKRSDIVIVMVGPQTHRAHGVLKEVAMAQAANKRIVQIIGYKDGEYTPVEGAGRLYSWNWENLKNILR